MIAFSFDQQVFVDVSSRAGVRELAPGQVVAVDPTEQTYTAEFETDLPGIAEGKDALLFFHQRRTFMQLSINVVHTCLPDEGEDIKATIIFTANGEPVSAESRQVYRVFLGLTGKTVGFDDDSRCLMQDVSSTGFAVNAFSEHEVGDTVEAWVEHDGVTYAGKVSVQSVRDLGGGEYRYGVQCLDQGDLAEGVRRLSNAMEREQLKRMSGAV